MEHNKAQEKVISTIEGQMIVIACPGSGKTTTLLKRIDHMVHSGIDPENILMITFTSAAAKGDERAICQTVSNYGSYILYDPCFMSCNLAEIL